MKLYFMYIDGEIPEGSRLYQTCRNILSQYGYKNERKMMRLFDKHQKLQKIEGDLFYEQDTGMDQ